LVGVVACSTVGERVRGAVARGLELDDVDDDDPLVGDGGGRGEVPPVACFIAVFFLGPLKGFGIFW